jgi:hypothetical protein
VGGPVAYPEGHEAAWDSDCRSNGKTRHPTPEKDEQYVIPTANRFYERVRCCEQYRSEQHQKKSCLSVRRAGGRQTMEGGQKSRRSVQHDVVSSLRKNDGHSPVGGHAVGVVCGLGPDPTSVARLGQSRLLPTLEVASHQADEILRREQLQAEAAKRCEFGRRRQAEVGPLRAILVMAIDV